MAEMSSLDKRAIDAYVAFITACGWHIPPPSDVFRAGYLAGAAAVVAQEAE